MRDILERLRDRRSCGEGDCENGMMIEEAAAEIAFLRREIERLNLCLTIEKKLRHNAEIEAVRRD